MGPVSETEGGAGKAGISRFSVSRKRTWIIVGAVLAVLAIGLGVGLGVGLSQRSGSDSDSGSGSGSNSNSSSNSNPPALQPNSSLPGNSSATSGDFWKPKAGDSWQIVIAYALNDTSYNVSVYDIDLFLNPSTTIDQLHSQGRKVICYFSAGSYEDFRPDSSSFHKEDYSKPLVGWEGEWWLNTNSTNVRDIMKKRLQLAKSIGCDGVDPDNIDGYDNDTGLDLTTGDAIEYMTFLAGEAHALNMSIGLKNGGTIVNQTLDIMEWEVNESCEQYGECGLFKPFIDADKPVFHIEYPSGAPVISEKTKEGICGNADTKGFSTVMKELALTNFVESC